MNPTLKIDPTDLFEAFTIRIAADSMDAGYPMGANVDVDFIQPGMQMPGDYMDANSVETTKFKAIQDQQRADQAAQYDRDNASGQAHGADPTNPAQQTAPYGQLVNAAKEAKGFLNKQARTNVTMGVLAELDDRDSLAGARVIYKNATSNITGTIIAVGDSEFAVVWDDKTASVERKDDYELVVKA